MYPKSIVSTLLALALFGVAVPAAVAKKPGAGPVLKFDLPDDKGSIWLRGQLRHRLEYDERRDFVHADTAQWVSQRARLTLGGNLFKRLEFVFQIQDVRTWGEEVFLAGPAGSQVNNPILSNLNDYSADGFDVHQAYAEVRLWRGLFFRGGRMEIAHDNHRIIGTVDWTQQARAFDGAMLRWAGPWVKAHIFWAKLAESHRAPHPTVDGDADLVSLWARVHRWKFFRASLSYVADIDQRGAVDRHRHTIGLFVDGLPIKGLKYTGEFYYQLGKQGVADIRAFLAAVRVDYTIPVRTTPAVSVWADIISGDGNPAAGPIRSFNTLFATNHKFYGFMDLFLNTQAHTGNRGLLDVGARVKIGPVAKRLVAFVDYHAFRLMRPDAAGNLALGHEVDMIVKFKAWRFLGLMAGYSVFIPHSAMSALKGGGDQLEHWFFLQTNIAF